MFFPLFFALLFVHLHAKETVYFSETFPDKTSIDSWVSSTHKGLELEKFVISAGESPADPVEDLGLQSPTDARFYAISKKLDEPFSNKDKTLVIQYTVKYDETVSCGGAYLKLMGPDIDQTDFYGETPYLIMFGPDICGHTKKVHVILNRNGTNHQIKKEIACKSDQITHLYTLIITPDNKYKVLIDNEKAEEGDIENDWDILPPKKIDDPSAKKPDDWVDEDTIPDPEDKKPEDWDQPKTIPDPNAKKPEDWDDEMDGTWERPQIDNPDHKGEWVQKTIPNPAYKGPWIAPQIDNPDYKADSNLYLFENISYLGFELWQVTSKSIFDNILLTDSPDFAKEEGERLWRKRFKADTELEKKKEEERAKKAETPDPEMLEKTKKQMEEAQKNEKEEGKDAEKEPVEAEEKVPTSEEKESPEEPKPELREEL